MAAGFCPRCATPRTGTLRYCASCAYDFWGAAAPSRSAERPPEDAASAEQPTAVRTGRDLTLLWLMLVPGVIGALLVGFLTKFDPWGIGIGAFIGLAVGAWIQKLYMETSNYSNLRRIGRK